MDIFKTLIDNTTSDIRAKELTKEEIKSLFKNTIERHMKDIIDAVTTLQEGINSEDFSADTLRKEVSRIDNIAKELSSVANQIAKPLPYYEYMIKRREGTLPKKKKEPKYKVERRCYGYKDMAKYGNDTDKIINDFNDKYKPHHWEESSRTYFVIYERIPNIDPLNTYVNWKEISRVKYYDFLNAKSKEKEEKNTVQGLDLL